MTFKDELSTLIKGEVKEDQISLKIYSTDASIFEISPLLVVLPKDEEDLIHTVKFAQKHHIPIIARGAATSLTGACLGKGIIIDFSKYMNQILEINPNEQFAICQPGVVQDELNKQLKPFGLRLGPNTSTGNRATLGGMIGNNSAGSHSLRYGCTADALLEVDLILSNGTKLHLSNNKPLDLLLNIKNIYEEAIKNTFPKLSRRSSGYSLDRLDRPASFIASSEGTLGLISIIKVKLEKLPSLTFLFVLEYETLFKALDSVKELLSFNPSALELIDDKIIEMGKISSIHKEDLSFIKGNPQAILMIEFDDKNLKEAFQKVYPLMPEKTPEKVWNLRKAGLGLLLSRRTYSRAISLFEDVALKPEEISSFMKPMQAILQKYNKTVGLYGHVGAGCIHMNLFIDFHNEKNLLKPMLDEVSSLILSFKGVLSGEHGDGLVRSYLNKKIFGDTLYQAFLEIKKAFDPIGLFNPGKVVDAEPSFDKLRKPSSEKLKTYMDFSKEGGFDLSINLCNGNGQCRKKDSIMCPTFQATEDEYYSTRARANALRGMITGDIALESKELFKVLDYCIECKGCKKECPAIVDMAKLKSEYLYHYYQKNKRPLRDYLFGYIGKIQYYLSYSPNIANFLLNFSKPFLTKIGISSKRNLPILHKPFRSIKETDPDVVLFIDTFTTFNNPDIGNKAYELLKKLGLKVHTPKWVCCGRPFLSKGMLKEAKSSIEKLIASLKEFEHLPIVFLEPSCHSVLIDDSQSFGLSLKTLSIDEFLYDFISQKKPVFKHILENIALHTHCHDKSLKGSKNALEILKGLPGAHIFEIDAGCCGMAGSFGYETEHFDLSIKIAQSRLVKSIEDLPQKTTIIANGTSCRSQITFTTNNKPKHLVEVLLERL